MINAESCVTCSKVEAYTRARGQRKVKEEKEEKEDGVTKRHRMAMTKEFCLVLVRYKNQRIV